MPDLTVGQAVERLSHILIHVRARDLPRALRLALGQARFTDFVMRCGTHLMTQDMLTIMNCYQAQIERVEMVKEYTEWTEHKLKKATNETS